MGPDRLWAITIGTNMGNCAAYLALTLRLLLGGLEVGQNTLLRFYVLHIMVPPLRPSSSRSTLADS